PHTVGHNVVVDGYNSDDFFHLNFGWNGSSNGWYTMPPTSAPYNLTVIEGVVMDIFGNNPHVGVSEKMPGQKIQIRVDPVLRQAIISGFKTTSNLLNIRLFSLTGQMLLNNQVSPLPADGSVYFSMPKSMKGLYILVVDDGMGSRLSKKIIL
nr:C10 family peptidase [Bacteroidota bacterium]